MPIPNLKSLWNKDSFRTAIAILLVIGVIGGGYVLLGLALGTTTPIRVVESGSMCTDYYGGCDGFISLTHPFSQALHTGDLILIQAVNAASLNANYPNSDIIVYNSPIRTSPIVHRIVEKQNVNGTLYFQTKGDGSPPNVWPSIPNTDEYDPFYPMGVPQEQVEGKVVMRIPWFGWIALIMQKTNWGLPLVVGLILFLLVAEFMLPAFKKRRAAQQ